MIDHDSNNPSDVIDPDVYIRALNGLATPKEEDQVRGYLAAHFPRHARLQRKVRRRAFLRRIMANAIKAGAERGLAAGLLFLALPLMMLASVLIKLASRGPIFHRQSTRGKDERHFTMYKFRTKYCDPEPLSDNFWQRKPDVHRMPQFGLFLIKTHIEDLPQLLNVILGEMSLVGPRSERPEIAYQLEREIPHYHERFRVRPGITGLAEIMLGQDIDPIIVKRKMAFDMYYVQLRSFWLNAKILTATPFAMWGMSAARLSRWFRLPSEDECRRVTEASGIEKTTGLDSKFRTIR
jgi:lipopolysaccharide/colanic/teichoic acid biosynthesis glycosyltransferase